MIALHSAVIQDIGYSPAEMVYGANIRLPGEMFENSNPKYSDDWMESFRSSMNKLKPIPALRHGRHNTFVPKDIRTCSHVSVRIDAVRKPLQRPYEGPFKVVSRTNKIFKIIQNGKEKVISIDRLKPAFILNESKLTQDSMDNSQSQDENTQPLTLRSGKRVTFAPGV
ncbi:uncharacterized protein LOC142231032 [Haematobia irritans]|uniref:uncharacterized protein LOC142231032 n=1 Tax=Haematobia irritans TaxID=7368 RepID=UPI003F503CD3